MATDDPLNVLVLQEGLTWREVELLRTLRNHLLQVRTHYNAETVNGVLLRNSGVAASLFRSFAARFDPSITDGREARVAAADAEVKKALEAVGSLAEDEVLRGIDNLIRAALRTNFYQQPTRPVVSIKVYAGSGGDAVAPPDGRDLRPLAAAGGIHRGGKVPAAGSAGANRHDDFRTEVLGLMKTQMVKTRSSSGGIEGRLVLKGEVPPRPRWTTTIHRYPRVRLRPARHHGHIVDGR